MVDVVSPSHEKIICGFINRARNIIWTDIIIRQIFNALKISAGFLLFLGIINFSIQYIPVLVAVCISSAPIFFASVFSIISRPSVITSAKIADEKLGTFSLFTTSYEIFQLNKNESESLFMPWIQYKARQTIDRLSNQDITQALRESKKIPWIEIAIIILSLCLFLNPKTSNESIVSPQTQAPVFIDSSTAHHDSKSDLIDEIRSIDSNSTSNENSPMNESDTLTFASNSKHESSSLEVESVLDKTVQNIHTSPADKFSDPSTGSSTLDHTDSDALSGLQLSAPGIGTLKDDRLTRHNFDTKSNKQLQVVEISDQDGSLVNDSSAAVAFNNNDHRTTEKDPTTLNKKISYANRRNYFLIEPFKISHKVYIDNYFQQINSKQ